MSEKDDQTRADRKLRVAAIGVGSLGRHHARNYAEMAAEGRIELVGVCDTDPATAASISAAHGCKEYSDWRDLIGKVDAVSIATPTETHSEIACAFLENGVHTLVEKPLAMSLDDADRMFAASAASVAKLMTAQLERVVYVKSQMGVWIIDADENIQRTYLVSGRLNQPTPGTYHVFTRSTYTCNINHSNVCMRWMVRFAHGPGGDNIGFHEIPRKNGAPVQGNHQLGQALSSGCVRQSTDDAQFMWAWAGIGTTVVVIQ